MRHDIRQTSYMALPGLKPGIKFLGSTSTLICDIIGLVEQEFKVPFKKILDKNRHRDILTARIAATFLVKKHTDNTLCYIGQLFKRDHTSIIYSVRKAEDLLATNPIFKQQLLFIENKLGK